ncbi:DNA/RNA helicase [Corynebacterium humireducens NBRC 106098 = DSM 45392]|uniref:DNA/RNA helicase n=1 Tax=Corynebacterium humireducens NBRC 106098 = DSM 45392 TaxID=1223515 RepID=A0A0B5DB16_9CORY|nr:DEAD/DEAH box helicase [Corynebacterium humireducens]AJE32904.1 DNA/RNA helicase [Corynebacterium humireducens NBRC 106098 = DSM 45392]
MPSFLLHGLWMPSGLHLWIEQVEGHRVVLPSSVPPEQFPPAARSLLDDRSYRHRLKVELRTPRGREVELRIPTSAYAPEHAVAVLSQLSFLLHPGAAATKAQRAAIAPDLMWLIQMNAGLTRFVQAGRVVPKLVFEDGQWWPHWQLASGLGERGWLAEMIAAAPGILTANNKAIEEIADHLVHWIAADLLQDLATSTRPYPWHDFADSLMNSTPLRRGGPGLLRAMNDWKDSITAIDLQMVFIVEEPPREDELAETSGDPEDATWPVRVQVRSGTDAPVPIRAEELDRSSVEKLRLAQRRAINIAEHLDPALRTRGPERHEERNGDWDVYLSTAEIVDFISGAVPRLQAAGFTVMLPKAWSAYETKARLETREVADAAGAATQKHFGLDKLVEYNWRLSVGDVELSDEEMDQLVRSKSGLIKLRGEWVMADQSALNRITSYMEELAETSRKRRCRELEKAAALAERARVAEQPGWEALVADVERRREEFNAEHAGHDGFGEVSIAELRQLALESMVEDPVEFTGSTWHTALLGGADALTTKAPERIALPDTVDAELREYQRRGVDWLYWMSRNNFGAVLADDMGLGKTLQLLSLLAIEIDRGEAAGPTLVVAPTSVVGNWAKEAARFVPSLRVMVHHGPDRYHGEELTERVAESDLVITSYGVVGRDFAEMGEQPWDRVVLDEAQAIKNSTTRASKAVRSLPSRHRVALTGTPVENRLSEMRSILDFCNPGVLGSASFFRNHFAKAIEREHDEQMTERLRLLTAPFILRRLKTDPAIIDDLPEKNEEIITVEMSTEQAALYTALVEDVQARLEQREGMARRGLVLATITRIKQICNHPAQYLGDGSPVTVRGRHRSGKVEELMRLLDEAIRTGQRMLIFTQYKAFGDILVPYLSERLGETVPFLHGGVTKTRRDQMVAEFQAPDGPRAMILSLKAGGTGLNLTAASMVVHMDRWWNPAVENQATDRAFRIGQQRDVAVYKMITAGTLEESIQDILDGKTELAGAVIGEGEGWITELGPEQLAQLMSYRGRDA